MGFKKVFKALQEIFPLIDSRALRAVAIEHSNDADAAVEAVLTEIIPLFDERSIQSSFSSESRSMAQSPKAIVEPVATDAHAVNVAGSTYEQNGSVSKDVNYKEKKSFHGASGASDANDGHTEPFYDTYSEIHEECGDAGIAELISSVQLAENGVKLSADEASHVEPVVMDEIKLNNHHDETSVESEGVASVSDKKSSETSIKTLFHQSSCNALGTSKDIDTCANQNVHGCFQGLENSDETLDKDWNTGILQDSYQGNPRVGGNPSEMRPITVGLPALGSVEDLTSSRSESIVMSNTPDTNLERSEVIALTDATPKIEANSEIVDAEDEYNLNSLVSRSGQVCSIDLLDDIISDARNNKKTLFSVMESVITLIKEVELKEKDAEQAKEEASRGGFDILNRAEELKRMLQHAKEANDMHSGEVYGERAILATELRELQSRVLSLSDERNKSLAILDEMHQTLEVRLAVVEKEIKSVVEEKLEREKSAMEALADQELLMEKVVEESNLLKQEAEENAKLQEFLVDRGRVVDMLQGEIAVICQDVRLLKEKFDQRVPFCESLSSSQTSCRLASSSSNLSSKSGVLVQTDEEQGSNSAESLDNPKTDLVSCFDEQLSVEEAIRSKSMAPVEEEWEIFDSLDAYV